MHKSYLILLLLFPCSASAIVNIESLRMDETKQGWSSSLAFSLSGKKGSVDNDSASFSIGSQWVEPHSRTLLIGALDYSESSGVKDDEEYFAHLRHTHQWTSTLDWELFTQKEFQPFTYNRKRSLFGGGLRSTMHWQGLVGHAGFGVMKEFESAITVTQQNRQLENDRFNLFANLKYPFSSPANWVGLVYYQPKVTNSNDYQMVMTTGVDAQMFGPLHILFDITYQYDTHPTVPNLEQRNYKYNAAFEIEF